MKKIFGGNNNKLNYCTIQYKAARKTRNGEECCGEWMDDQPSADALK